MYRIVYTSCAIKCPHCATSIKYKQGRVPGGVNDKGGWLLKCDACLEIFALPVENPSDFSGIVSGATIEESWDNETQNKADFLKEHAVQEMNLEILSYTEEALEPILFDFNSNPIFVNSNGENLERLAYSSLEQALNKKNKSGKNEIEHYYRTYFNFYVKGRCGEPKYSYILLEFEDGNGLNHTAFFYFTFSGNGKMPNTLNEYLLIEVTDHLLHSELVNGIYTRDACKRYLEKFLIRWKGYYSSIVVTVPFIGYQNQKLEKREALWDWLKKFLADDNSIFYTRQIAITLLNESRKKSGIPVDILKEFNITETGINTAIKHNFFHAKFYAGVDTEETEILKGSYNLHENSYLENLDQQIFSTDFFKERYLTPMGIDSSKLTSAKSDAFWIDLRKGTSNVEFQCVNGKTLFNKLL